MEKFTKIIATIGPASDSEDMIRKLYEEGMNVARLNFSHGSFEYFELVIQRIKKVSDDIAILLDTKGPEIRTGQVCNDNVVLRDGESVIVTNKDNICDNNRITIDYHSLESLKKGNRILIDDGLLELNVIENNKDELVTEVIHGGKLESNKTVCLAGYNLEVPFLSEQDKKDILFGIKHDVDFIAASFVKEPSNIEELKDFLKKHKSKAHVIAKIEHWQPIKHLAEIIKISDGVMIARGDLGVEIALERVPQIQSRIIDACNELGRPVIVATQMLESMKHSPKPTRAEVSDVSQAILQGADAIMLSGETAAGAYPERAVKVMSRIAKVYDKHVKSNIMSGNDLFHKSAVTLFVTKAAYHASIDIDAKLILTPTQSGYSARKVSRFRPKCPVIAITNDMTILRQLQLSWGVFPFFQKSMKDLDENVKNILTELLEDKKISKDDRIVITSGQLNQTGTTNQLKVVEVKDYVE